MSGNLLVNEIFGPVWQGEGRQAGQRCFFIRTATCNLECSWCDTPQTWVFSERKVKKHALTLTPYDIVQESHKQTAGAILFELRRLGASTGDLIVISGGEPLLQQKALEELIDVLREAGHTRFAIETAGTIALDMTLEAGIELSIVVSPKMASSGNALEKRYNPQAINLFNMMGADFKFVVSNAQDEHEVDEFVTEHEIPLERVWVMPEGITREDVLAKAIYMAEWASNSGYNLTLRQHVLLYGNERKR